MKLYRIIALLVLTIVNHAWANQEQGPSEQEPVMIHVIAVPDDSPAPSATSSNYNPDEDFEFPDDPSMPKIPSNITLDDMQPTWKEKMALVLTAIKQLSREAKNKVSTHIIAHNRAYLVGLICVAGATTALVVYWKKRKADQLASA